ncbi:MAG: hypothetical protein IJD83_06015 [Clostridia bacterium]|nr:hypothetical protein [Clostridia bacterium]
MSSIRAVTFWILRARRRADSCAYPLCTKSREKRSILTVQLQKRKNTAPGRIGRALCPIWLRQSWCSAMLVCMTGSTTI